MDLGYGCPLPSARPQLPISHRHQLRQSPARVGGIPWLSLTCKPLALLVLLAVAVSPLQAQDPDPAAGLPVCDRTEQVRDAIVSAVGVSSCAEVTEAHLAEITVLSLAGRDIRTLKTGDFASLSALESLYLNNSPLTELPSDIFTGLAALRTLNLNNNNLAALPAGVFADLTALEHMQMRRNNLAALSAGAFAGLTTLRVLYLNDNNLAALPDGVFNGLILLETLYLDSNSLMELPPDAFTGLAALKVLGLRDNSLTVLPVGIFSGTRALVDLRLHGNPGSEGFLPIANAGADQTVDAGQIATLAATASDTDPWGDNVRYAWAQIDNGGDLVTLKDAHTARPSFVMPAAATALEFELTVTGLGGAGYADTDSVTVLYPSAVVLVCYRTEQVRDAIVAAVDGVSNCANVTEAHLAGITSLNVENRGIMALKAGDFSGFAALEDLYMERNSLSVLPEEIFAGLAALNSLDLGGNGLTALPEGVFSGLTALQLLFLNNNSLTALPPTIFDGLRELGSLSVHDNLLTTLTVGVFSDLAALDTLLLNGNRLVELPPGIFNGLSALHGLHLYDNSLTALPAGLFSDLRELELLNLSGNSLTALPTGLFSDLRALRILFLQGNPGSEDFLPIADAGAGQVVEAGQIVTLTATASDTDPWGDNVRYAWAQIDNGGDLVTLKDAHTARPSFVMPAGATALEFELTVTGLGGAGYADTDSVTVLDPSVVVPVCDRTEQVRDAIVAAVDGVSNCANVTEADLAGITQLFLMYESIGALQVGDFSGLAALETLDLSDNPLTELPPTIFDGLRALYSLDLSNNSLTELPPAISGLRALSTLRLHDNRLTALPAGAFSSLTDLRFLSLNNNLLTELPPAIFDGLGALNILRLQGNRLTALPAGVFTGPAALSALYLNSNSLAALPSGIFDRLAELEVLYLNNNNLTALPSGIFTGLSDLETLKLSDNSLTELPAGLFSDLTELDYLSLSNNLLTELPAGLFSGLRVLTVLRLEGNSLYVLPAGAFAGLARLGILYLNDNSLTALPPSAFAGLAALDILYLNGNGLTELPAGAFAGLTALRFLLLDDNGLTALPTGAFTGLTALETLDLSNNHLMELPEGVFRGLTALRSLDLNDNSLTALTAGVFRGLTALRSLDLNTNSLTVLPAGLFSDLRVLRTLFLQNNPGSEDFLPIANAGADQVVEAGQIATLRAIASDTDPWGGNVRYAWAQIDNGGDLVTLKDGKTARPSFVMPAAATVLEFELTVTGRGGARYADTGRVTVLDPSAVVPVCDRTEQVRDAIVAAVDGVSNCANVTEADLAGITQLFLGDESIGALQVGDFSGLAALNSLVLDNNSLTELPPKIFGGLADLRALFLRGNGLAALPLGVFGGLTDLESLYLNANSLTALATGVFTGLTELETLELSGNGLMALTASVFAGLRELSALHLNDNSLTTLPAGTFASLTALQFLHLNDNSLAALPAGTFAGLTALQFLFLNNNGLTALSAGAFAGLTRLRVLFLNDNNLAELPSDVFTGLASLLDLHLNDNSLTTLPASAFASLAALKLLTLNNNNLAALPAGVFDDPYRLQFLHLESNRLTVLPAGIFSGTRKLVGLHLHGNPGSRGFLPIASAGADQVVEAGQIATLTATVSDTDPWGDNVSYAWAQIDNSGNAVVLMGADTARPSFVMPAGATALEFELTVTGRGGARYADTDSVTVRLAAAVVTLSGPVHDLLPADATAIAGDELILVYSYSADDLHGRTLMGNIDVVAAVDGVAITPAVNYADGDRGEITIILSRAEYPEPGEHQLAVTLSLSAAAEGFVLAEPSSMTTPFSFLPLPPTVLEVRQAEGNQGKRGAAGNDIIKLGYIFEYAADNRLNRPRAGLSVQIDVELCADAGGGCAILPGASQALMLDGNGSLTLRVDRTLAALSVFGEADADSIRHGRVLLRTAGNGDFAATAAATTFSFAIAAAVVTLSGPVHDLLPADATAIVGDVLSLIYSYGADDLRGRALTGSIEVAASIDGAAITYDIRIDGVRGEITVVLRRQEYPDPGEHELAVALSAAAEGFVLAEPSLIETPFSFLPLPPTVLEVRQAEGNQGKRGAAGNDIIELGYIFEYAADNRLNRPRAGLSVQIDVELCADAGGGCAILPGASQALMLDGNGSLTLRVDRTLAALSVFGEADADSIRHGRVLLSTAGAADFAATAAATTFSFAIAAAVVTLSGPVHDLLPADATAIVGDVLSLIYSYGADDLRGRALTGSIEVAASIDGAAITYDIRIDGVRGEITVVLRRQEYPDPGEHELAVALSAAAEGFVLAEPSLIETPFSFLPLPPTVLEVRQAEGNQGKRGAAGNDIIELGYIFEYAASNRLNRPRAGLSVQIDVELCADAGGGCAILPGASQALMLDGNGSLTLRVDRTLAALSVFGEADADSIRHGRVLLSTAGAGDFAATAAATTFSFAVAAAVVTLSGPVHDPLPADATAIVGDVLSLIYSYSADDLRGRVLTGSIEVAASIDGAAITYDIRIDGVRGEITVVLLREKYPYPGEHELAVALSLSAAAEGFVLGEPSSMTTPFSFLPLPPTVLEVRQAEGNQGKRGAAGNDIIELGYIFEYAASNRLNRPRAGLSVQIDVELCADAGGGCAILPGASQALMLDGNGSLTLRVDRTLAALSVFGEADADSIRHGRVLLRTAGDGDFAATAAATTFSFAVAAAVVTLSGPVPDPLPADATAIAGNELRLVYSYSADDLRGRVLAGNIEVAAAVDDVPIVPDTRVDGAGGEITVVLQRQTYPDPDEHELVVSLSAAAEGFVFGGTSSIATPFSFLPLPPTVLEVRQAEGNQGKRGAAGNDIIELGYSFEYAADNRLDRPRAGLSVQVDIELCADAGGGCVSLPMASQALMLDGNGSLTPRVDRTLAALSVFGEADADSIRHGRVLLSTAGDGDFAATAAATTFSFAVAAAVVTLSGPVHDLLPADATAIAGDVLSLVYSYSADDLRGRTLMGNIDVTAAVDGVAITPAVNYVDGARGEITIILSRAEYPEPGEHLLAVRLSLSATAEGFVLAAPSSIATPFSFGALVVPDTVVTLSGPGPVATTDIVGGELSLVYSYSADDLHGRVLTGSIEVAASIDGVAITTSIEVDEARGRGEITVVLLRREYPEPGEHQLAVTLSLGAAATGFVLGETSSITTPFSFGAPAVIDTVVTLSGPVHDLLPADATAIAGDKLSLVYSCIADDLRGRILTGSIEVAAAIDGTAIVPDISVAGTRGEITVVLRRQAYPEPGEHELTVILSLSAAATGFVLGGTSSISTTFGFSPISTAIAEDGTCQLGMLGPGEKCLYRGSSYYLSVLEAAFGPQMFFFGPNEVGEPLNLENALNPHDFSDFRVYNLEAIKEGRGYRIIRVYSAPAYPDGELSGSMDGATILLTVLFFFVNLALGLAGGPRRRLWR